MEVGVLASTVVANFLLPYLKLGVEGLAAKLAETGSEAAAGHVAGLAQGAWERVKGAFGARGEAAVAESFERYPEESVPVVQRALKEILEDDEQLVRQLEEMLESQSPDGSGSAINIVGSSNVKVIAAFATIGDQAIVAGEYNVYGPPGTPSRPIPPPPPPPRGPSSSS